GSTPAHRLDAAVIVILEPAFVTPELLLQMARRLVIRRHGFRTMTMGLENESGREMQGAIGSELRALLLERDMGRDSAVEIFLGDIEKAILDMRPQRCANVQIFASDLDLHIT